MRVRSALLSPFASLTTMTSISVILSLPSCTGDDPVFIAPQDEGGVIPDAGGAAADAANQTGGDARADASNVPIRGRVIDARGRPLNSATVRIGSRLIMTAGAGEFEVPAEEVLGLGSSSTYDAAVVSAVAPNVVSSGFEVTWFRGLTQRSPTLQVASTQPYAPVIVKGVLSPPPSLPLPLQANYFLQLAFVSSQGIGERTYQQTELALGDFGFNGIFSGNRPAVQGSAHAFAFTAANTGEVTGYHAVGNTNALVVATPGTITVNNVSLSSVSGAGSLTGVITSSAPELQKPSAYLMARPSGADRSFRVWVTTTNNNIFSLAPPPESVNGYTYGVALFADSNSGNGSSSVAHRHKLPARQQSIGMSLPAPPTLEAPVSGANVARSASLEWATAPASNSVFSVEVTCGGTPAAYKATILTGIRSTTFPAAINSVDVPGNSACRWTVTTMSPGSVDLLAESHVSRKDVFVTDEDGTLATSASSSFTTGP